jgi:hypothetical protein
LTNGTWTYLTAGEEMLLLDALSSFRDRRRTKIAQVDALIVKLAKGALQPNITIGIHQGQVRSVRGNPFPIRICDYDGFDLPDVDERGKPCEIWLEPADKKVKRA